LRLNFEQDENREESLEEGLGKPAGLAERFIPVSFVFVFYFFYL
jgi:hypothetical protein